jgi:hypothetical protein
VLIVSSALSVVYQTALYRYASGATVPTAFGDVAMRRAFAPRRR